MAASNLVIVESPAKAKTINKYLGSDYIVLASFGHVRDLNPKDGSVKPDDDFSMVWQNGERSDKPLREIKNAVKKVDTVWLAPDPDREGEAIAWHVHEILKEENLLEGKDVRRVTFNEITKTAIKEAFDHARGLDESLIQAYLARRALDYLFGYTLSPILWRKLPGSRSAGRVQSVALRLICEREFEIEKFVPQEYWSIEAALETGAQKSFTARLTHLDGNKLDKFDINNEKAATEAVRKIQAQALRVQSIEKKQVKRSPSAPFITSTLQQEASRKLGFSASQTMRTAQKLYEGIDLGGETVGLITYMRTDGTTLSNEAVSQARTVIGHEYGDKYVPDAPRLYKSKAKNAQEAHEAIRPTDLSRLPLDLRHHLDDQMLKLYELIWKRTIASQMENALLDQMAVDITGEDGQVVLRANGSVVAFDGFLKLYIEGQDDSDDEDEGTSRDRLLPPLTEGDALKTQDVTPNQHFTQPPPRYSEASLVKRLEELGIGRPSTYASILQVLRDRNYVTLEKRRFFPEDRGRIVTAFLMKFFARYVDYDFTANLEDDLDTITTGQIYWKEALRQFWDEFSAAIDQTKDLTITEVIDHLNEELGEHFFPKPENGDDPRKCQACETGELSLKLGKYGAFIGCSNYPECKYTRPLVSPDGEADDAEAAKLAADGSKVLGEDPKTGRTVTLRKGPYGPYVQIDPPEESKDKPKRQGLPRGTQIGDVDLAAALKLLELPRHIGDHPETGKKIEGGIGRFGPYVKYDGRYKSIPKGEDVLTIGMNRAMDLIAQMKEKKETTKKAPAKKAPTKKKGPTKKKAATKKKTTKKPAAKKKAK